ncbi:hypothetical protein [Aggregatilinea lenta]|uniref:hypothetical protein n=1 Tax=Aggregatilinea lenta TaxID=913108 RepID=UPI0013C35F32|nr:hypothetical protein [Aggregatilinea lenta]
MPRSADLPAMPEPQILLRDTPLYDRFSPNAQRIRQLESFSETIDLYCVECGDRSIFRDINFVQYNARPLAASMIPVSEIQGIEDRANERALSSHFFSVELECTRNRSHKTYFVFNVGEGFICKVGQYPSLADLEIAELGKYRAVLGSSYGELTRAVGLAAHGIGIGSFIYLRRIFENLVFEAAQEKSESDSAWSIEQWKHKRMEDKIKELEGILPEDLIANRAIYAILSKGVHELGENECLEYFATIQSGIELILDEKLTKIQRQKKQKSLQQAISKITGKLSSDS